MSLKSISLMLLVSLAATLWSTPTACRAGEIFVVVGPDNGAVGEYDSSTGDAINPYLVQNASPGGAGAIAASNGILFVTNSPAGTIGEYNTSGGPVNASLITGLGAENDLNLAVSGGGLFVSNALAGTIGEYDTATGAAINASLIYPNGTPFAIAISGDNLFVVNGGGNNPTTISEYTTGGTTVNASLVTGLVEPLGLAVSGGDLFVASSQTGAIGEYDATTGALINASLISGIGANTVTSLAALGGDLYVTYGGGGVSGAAWISEYTTSGALVNAALVTDLSQPGGIAVVTPEPSTLVMLAIGAGALGVAAGRRRFRTPSPKGIR